MVESLRVRGFDLFWCLGFMGLGVRELDASGFWSCCRVSGVGVFQGVVSGSWDPHETTKLVSWNFPIRDTP